MKQFNNHTTLIPQIIGDIFPDCNDLGLVDEYIEQGVHTSDFDLSEGFKMRVLEGKKGIFYNVFKAK